MKSQNSRTRGPRPHGGGRRRPQYRDSEGRREQRSERQKPQAKVSLWHKILAIFGVGPAKRSAADARSEQPRQQADRNRPRANPPERVEVTSPRLYIGNLSYDATESDLFELFSGIGQVQNAEIVTHRDTYRSKGFGFVNMLTIEEAVRAVATLHDKDFMGRKLVVSGSRSEGVREPSV